MQKTIMASIGIFTLCFAGSPAGAVPIVPDVAGHEAGLIKTHGVHWPCRRDRWGWHRSPDGDRRHCGRDLGQPGIYLEFGSRRHHRHHRDHDGRPPDGGRKRDHKMDRSRK